MTRSGMEIMTCSRNFRFFQHFQPANYILSNLVVQRLHLNLSDVLQAQLKGKVDGIEEALVTAAERVDGVGKVRAYLGADLLAGEAEGGFLDAQETFLNPPLALDSDGFSANGVFVYLVAQLTRQAQERRALLLQRVLWASVSHFFRAFVRAPT